MSINKHSVDSTKEPKGLQLQQMQESHQSNLGHSVKALCLPKRNAGVLVWIPSLQKKFRKTLQGMHLFTTTTSPEWELCAEVFFDCRRTHFQDVQHCVGSTQARISPFVSCSALPSMRLILIINKNNKLPRTNLKQKMTYHSNENLPITLSPLQGLCSAING